MRPRCRHRYSWTSGWSDNRCPHRTLLWFCIEHWLDRCRWEWRGRWGVCQLDLSNLNRPYVQVDEERPVKWAALSWGNGNGDPVWFVQVNRREDAA